MEVENILAEPRSNITPRSHHDIDFKDQGHYTKVKIKVKPNIAPTLPTNIPIKYQLSTPYSLRNRAWTVF